MTKNIHDLSPQFSGVFRQDAREAIPGAERYIAGPGNHEGQTILMLTMSMQGLVSQTGYEMNALLRQLMPGVAVGTPTRQKEWCDRSLVPTEMMSRERDGDRQVYSLTEDGEKYVSLGGALLSLGEIYNRALFDYFGKSHDQKGQNNPQELRFKTVQYLLGHSVKGRTYEGLCEYIGTKPKSATTGRILRSLSDVGLIHYQSWDGSMTPTYQPTEKIEHPIAENASEQYAAVVEFLRLKQRRVVSISEVITYLDSKGVIDSSVSAKETRLTAHSIIATLASTGRISRVTTREPGGTLPVSITEKQRSELEAVWRIFVRFIEKDELFLRDGTKAAASFLADPLRLVAAMERRTRVAGYAIRDKSADLETVRRLVETEGDVTVTSLVKLIAEYPDLPRFSYSTVRRMLCALALAGSITQDDSSGILHFKPGVI